MMQDWYDKMVKALQLNGKGERSQQAYARAVRKLAEHYHKSPDLVTDEELRQYFLHRTNVTGWSRVACTIALCGIKFFYEHTLKRECSSPSSATCWPLSKSSSIQTIL